MRRSHCIPLMLAAACASAHGAGSIKTDGTVGAAQTLAGPAFVIPQTLGRVAGANLFQSFSVFSVGTGESATFTTTSASITNVIARVTGGSASQINGLLALTPAAASANLFFMNPAGVMFGAGGSVNVPGAFYATTANYIKFPDGKFFVDAAQTSTFSAAAPEAFGFLGSTRASVALSSGTGLNGPLFTYNNPAGSFHLIAGDLSLDGATISTKTGDIRLVAFGGGAGDVPLTGGVPSASGNLSLINGSALGTLANGSTPGGNISISAGPISLSGTSIISASTTSNGDAGSIAIAGASLDVDATGIGASSIFSDSKYFGGPAVLGRSGSIQISLTGALTMTGLASLITTESSSAGGAGNIIISAGNVILAGSSIESDTGGTANAGTVNVTASGAITLQKGGQITSLANAVSSGNAGAVNVSAGSLSIDGSGATLFGLRSGIYTTAQGPDGINPGALGSAGNVSVSVSGGIGMRGGGRISSSTSATPGSAGTLSVQAGSISIDGSGTSIDALASSGSSGQTGTVDVNAGSIFLSNGGKVSIQNDATVVSPAAIMPTFLNVTAGSLEMTNASITAASTGNVAASGIRIIYSDKAFLDPSFITTTSNSGNGGPIFIQGGGPLVLSSSAITTSVTGANGNGGNINITAPALVMINGFIQANTAAALASGGAINLSVDTVLPNNGIVLVGGSTPLVFNALGDTNVIQAAAPTGVNGVIQVRPPTLDISGTLVGLGGRVIGNAGLGRTLCSGAGGNSLVLAGRGSLPPSSSEFLRVQASPADGGVRGSLGGELIARASGC